MTFPNKFQAEGDYPKIKDAQPNQATVREIRKLYCDQKSEVSAILQYCWQGFECSQNKKKYEEVFHEIAKVEMHHMELLGAAMVQFGGNPDFFNVQGDAFSGRWVQYDRTLRKKLASDLRDEILAIKDYTKAARRVTNSSLKRLFLRIAEDEEVHARILQTLLYQLNDNKD